MEQEFDVWRVPIHDCWCRRMVCTGCDLQKWRKAISLILITRLSLRQLSNRLTSSLFLFTIRSCERGDTALIEMGCEIFSLTWTDCGLSVRKSSIQWQMVGFRPRRKLFQQSLQHNLMKHKLKTNTGFWHRCFSVPGGWVTYAGWWIRASSLEQFEGQAIPIIFWPSVGPWGAGRQLLPQRKLSSQLKAGVYPTCASIFFRSFVTVIFPFFQQMATV